MNCPKCQAQVDDNAKFCTSCGNPMPEQPVYQQPVYQQPVYQQPVYQQPQQPVYQQPVYQQPMYPQPRNVSKKEYLTQHAPEDVRRNGNLITIVMVVALALIVAGIVGTLTMNIFDVPVMSLLMNIAEADPQELLVELDEQVYDLETSFEYAKDSMDADERKDAQRLMDAMAKLVDNFSILNFRSLMTLVAELNETRDMGIDVADMEAAEMLINALFVVIIGFFVLPVLFVLLGGLLKNTPLTVFGLIFTLISQLILCAPLWTVLTLAVLIVQIVLCTKVNGAYKAYRNGCAPA